MRLIFRFLKPHWKLCALSVFLLIVDVAGALIIPTLAAEPLTETSYMINSLQSALASAERTFAFLDDEEEVPDTKTPVVLERAHGEIAFEHVSFGYFPDKILMKDISFTAHPGQKIAVVGATGAGKTTLINLLMRFYKVNAGRILYMENGNIIEQGTHSKLLEKGGAYAALYNSQFA